MRGTCDVLAAGTIDLYFYDELHGADRVNITTHLQQCTECRQALDDLGLIRAALDSCRQVSAPPGEDWSAFTSKLEARLPPSLADGPPERSAPVVTRLRHATPYLAMAALLAAVTTSVLIIVRAPADRPLEAGGRAAGPALRGAAEPASDPGLRSLSREHFQRSKLVVLGLATRDLARAGDEEWAYERDLAGALLNDTQLYRMAAEERGMHALAGVMRDLELVLLQTSMSPASDGTALHQLQQLIRRRDLLTKMNVVDTGGSD